MLNKNDQINKEVQSLLKIGDISGIAIVIGSIIGTGIFVAPSLVASFTSSPIAALCFWIAGGLLCFSGAVIFGNLSRLYPGGGGQYVYLRECVGKRFGILYGWLSFVIISPVSLAGLSIFFGEQIALVVPGITAFTIKAAAIGFLTFFTIVNYFGIRVSGGIQNVVVMLLLVLLLSVLAGAVLFLDGEGFLFSKMNLHDTAILASGSGESWKSGMLAMVAVLWTFDGFNTLTFITNEVKKGRIRVRILTFAGCLFVLLVYLASNLVAIKYIPHAKLVESRNFAAYLSELVMGDTGKYVVYLLTIAGIVTTMHSSVFIGPRITRALAEDGYAFKKLSRLHPVHTSPNNALVVQYFFVLTYILVGSFESMITIFIAVSWLFYALTVFGYMRKKITTGVFDSAMNILFIVTTVVMLAGAFMSEPVLSVAGLGVMIVGTIIAGSAANGSLQKSILKNQVLGHIFKLVDH